MFVRAKYAVAEEVDATLSHALVSMRTDVRRTSGRGTNITRRRRRARARTTHPATMRSIPSFQGS
jgi:hypothetical protein